MEQLIFKFVYWIHITAWKLNLRNISYKLAMYLIKYDDKKKLNMINHISLEKTLWDSKP